MRTFSAVILSAMIATASAGAFAETKKPDASQKPTMTKVQTHAKDKTEKTMKAGQASSSQYK